MPCAPSAREIQVEKFRAKPVQCRSGNIIAPHFVATLQPLSSRQGFEQSVMTLLRIVIPLYPFV
jgi:hypothetical protein